MENFKLLQGENGVDILEIEDNGEIKLFIVDLIHSIKIINNGIYIEHENGLIDSIGVYPDIIYAKEAKKELDKILGFNACDKELDLSDDDLDIMIIN